MREPRPRRSVRHGRQWRRRPNNSTGDAMLLVPGHLTTASSDLQPAKGTGLVVGTTRFSEDEEDILLRLHALLGNRWPLIAARLPGRTGEEVKAYWDSLMTTTNLKCADHDNHRMLLQALQASPDNYGEEQHRSFRNNGSDVAASDDGGVSDAGSSSRTNGARARTICASLN